jgi:thiamine pyrophosphate-dependent acetolactate synthase large subunit-like protein
VSGGAEVVGAAGPGGPGGRPPGGRGPGRLDRRRVVAQAIAEAGEDCLVISGLGAPSWDVAAAGDRALTFPLWGAMGGALAVGLGVAVGRPDRRVLVVTGDGELLMGLGSLSTVGHCQPANLAALVVDNGRYGETGMQPTHTAGRTDLASVARACGWGRAATLEDEAELTGLRDALWGAAGQSIVVVRVAPEEAPLVLPPRDGARLARRFGDAVAALPPGEAADRR